MKAIPMSYPKLKLKELSKQVYLEQGWDLPKGYIDPKFRDPKTFTLEQWQQAKRRNNDPREIKAIMQSCWKESDSRQAFEAAIKEHGYVLARGDWRGFVATDLHGEVYSIPKWVGVKTKAVQERLGGREYLPSLSEAKSRFSQELLPTVQRLKDAQAEILERQKAQAAERQRQITLRHLQQRDALKAEQATREAQEIRERQERFNKGLRGLLDRFNGTHKAIRQENEHAAYEALKRDQAERDDLIFRQQELRARQQEQTQQRLDALREQSNELSRDESYLQNLRQAEPRQLETPQDQTQTQETHPRNEPTPER